MAAPAKKVIGSVKVQCEAGKANPAPPIGPALGPYGINIMQFCKEFNDKTASQPGMIIPAVITIYADKSFTFITKTPPTAVLLKKEAGIATASAKPNRDKVAKVSKETVKKIAEIKMQDMNAATLDTAMSMVKGTARSMGIVVED